MKDSAQIVAHSPRSSARPFRRFIIVTALLLYPISFIALSFLSGFAFAGIEIFSAGYVVAWLKSLPANILPGSMQLWFFSIPFVACLTAIVVNYIRVITCNKRLPSIASIAPYTISAGACLWLLWTLSSYPRGMCSAFIDYHRGNPRYFVQGRQSDYWVRFSQILSERYGVHTTAVTVLSPTRQAYINGYSWLLHRSLNKEYHTNVLLSVAHEAARKSDGQQTGGAYSDPAAGSKSAHP